MKKISGEKTGDEAFFQKGKRGALAPKIVNGETEKRKVGNDAKNPTGYEPVEKHVMRPVKPLLLTVHLRVIIFVEDIIETFLSPTKNRTLLKTLPRHVPNHETRLGGFVGK